MFAAQEVVTHYNLNTRSSLGKRKYRIVMNDLRLQFILILIAAVIFILIGTTVITPTILVAWNSFSVEFMIGVCIFLITSVGSTFMFIAPKFSALYNILFYNLYRKNDTIKVGNILGVVEQISLFHTYIREPDGDLTILENTHTVKQSIYNYTKEGKSIVVIHAKVDSKKALVIQSLLSGDFEEFQILNDFTLYINSIIGLNSSKYWILEVTDTHITIVCQYDINTDFPAQSIISQIIFGLVQYLGVRQSNVINSHLVLTSMT